MVELRHITMHQSNLCQVKHTLLSDNLTDVYISRKEKRGENYHNRYHMRPFTTMATVTTNVPPTRPIPGSYGLPVLGPLKDRLDYFWFQGPETFFRSRMATHKSTVFRVNMPPTFPFFTSVDPRVVAVLDCASFAALFDSTLVDKRDVLIGDYMPSLSFTGGTRVVVYQDTTEETHGRIKSFCLDLLRRSARVWVDGFRGSLDIMLSTIEGELSNGNAIVSVLLQYSIL
jgi:hydroperoxide lyase